MTKNFIKDVIEWLKDDVRHITDGLTDNDKIAIAIGILALIGLFIWWPRLLLAILVCTAFGFWIGNAIEGVKNSGTR